MQESFMVTQFYDIFFPVQVVRCGNSYVTNSVVSYRALVTAPSSQQQLLSRGFMLKQKYLKNFRVAWNHVWNEI